MNNAVTDEEIPSYDGNVSLLPATVAGLMKLTVDNLRLIQDFHGEPLIESKEVLALRVLALRTGTLHLMKKKEARILLDQVSIMQEVAVAEW